METSPTSPPKSQIMMQEAEMNAGVGLLIPNLKLLEERVGTLASQLIDVQASMALKVHSSVTEQINQNMSMLERSLASKCDASELNQLGVQVQIFGASLATKAEAAIVERIGEQLQALTSSIVTNVDLQVLDDKIKLQAERLNESMKSLGTKVDASDFDNKWRTLQLAVSDFKKTTSVALAPLETAQGTISTSIVKCADATEVALMRGQIREAADAMSRKAEAGVVEQLSTQFRQLSTSLLQKADHVDLETLRGRITEVKAIVLDKAQLAQGEVDRLSVKLEGLTQGLTATLDQKMKDLVPPAVEHHVRTITADLTTVSLQLSDLISDNATLNDKLLELSRKIEKTREDALVAATQLEADLKRQSEIATMEKLDIQKACNCAIMQLTAEVSAKADKNEVSAKADKNLLEESILALTLDMKAKITSEVSDTAIRKRVDELSGRLELKADQRRVEGLVQMFNELKNDTRNQFDMITPLVCGKPRATAPLEQTQTVDPSRAIPSLERTQTVGPSRATSSLEQTQTLAPKRQLITASLPACSNNVANWLRRLVELLVSAKDPQSASDVLRVGGGFLYDSEVPLFNQQTQQGLVDILDSCTPAAFALNLSLEETQANGESPHRARMEMLEQKFYEITKAVGLKADAVEVSRLASMIQSLSDGTLGQAMRTQACVEQRQTQRVVTRPTSARIGTLGRRKT